jgi:hypothetical protein
VTSKLGEDGSKQGEVAQIEYPREVHFVSNDIKHLAKGKTRKGANTYVLKECLEHVGSVIGACQKLVRLPELGNYLLSLNVFFKKIYSVQD